MNEAKLRDILAAVVTLIGILAGGGGLYAGGVNAHDQAELRMVAIDGMSEALARQIRECQDAVAESFRDGVEMGKQQRER